MNPIASNPRPSFTFFAPTNIIRPAPRIIMPITAIGPNVRKDIPKATSRMITITTAAIANPILPRA